MMSYRKKYALCMLSIILACIAGINAPILIGPSLIIILIAGFTAFIISIKKDE